MRRRRPTRDEGSPRGRRRNARCWRARGSSGMPGPAVPGQVDDDDRGSVGERGRVRAPARSAAGEAVEEQQRRPRPAGPDLPAKAVDVDRGHAGRQGGGDRGRRLAMQLDVAGAVRPIAQDLDTRRGRSRRPAPSRSVAGRHVGELAAERRHDRPDIDAVRRPEQLLVVLGQADRGRIRSSPAAGTRRSRRRRCRPARSSRTGRGAARRRARSGRAGTTGRRRRARPARHRPPPRRARSRRRHRCRWRRGWTAAGWRGRCRAASRPCRGPACCCRPTAARRRAGARRGARTAGPRTARRAPRRRRSQSARARSAARSASHQSRAQARDRAGHHAASASASAFAVAVASAWTKVVGMIAGSLQPRSPSTTIWVRPRASRAASASASRSSSPRSGRRGRAWWASRHGPGRTRWSAWASTNERSCGPQRTPDSGSAAIGKPVAAARRARAAGRAGSSCGPATMRPRSAAGETAGEVRTAAGVEAGRPGDDRRERPRSARRRSVGQRPERRRTGSSGSRNPMFRWTGPAGPAARGRDRPPDDRPDVPPRLRLPVEQRQVDRPAHMDAEDPDLVDRLRRPAIAQLGRPVGGQQDERDARQRRLDDGGQEVGDGRPGGHDDRDRPARRAGKTEREEPGRPLVEQDPHAETRVRAQRRAQAASTATRGRR